MQGCGGMSEVGSRSALSSDFMEPFRAVAASAGIIITSCCLPIDTVLVGAMLD